MLSRRDFIKASSMTAALAAAGQLPLWAVDDNGTCYAAQGFAKALAMYSPPNTSVDAMSYRYSLVNMDKEYGRLATSHNGAGTYACEYAIQPGSQCKAEFAVNESLLAGVRSWTLASETKPVSKDMAGLCSYTECGQVTHGKAVVKVAGRTNSEFETAAPLLPDWLLPLAAPMLPTEPGGYRFSLLREGTYFLGGQQLQYDGMARITVKGGQTLELQNYLHVGEGTLPTNYLVDENGVTLIVTRGITVELLQ